MKKLIAVDEKLTTMLRIDPEKELWFKLASIIAHTGDSWYWLAGLFVIWLASIFVSDQWHYIAGVLAFSLLLEAAFVLSLKFIIRRRRPEGEWGEIYRNTDPHSFPSGHAARAVLIAVLSWTIAPAWFGTLVVVWAPLACFGRIVMGVHYVSDVIVGALIGFISGLVMLWAIPYIIPMIDTVIPFAF
jgi:membrane-associated phospholipid phosphatase